MISSQILKLLEKISQQLETISVSQEEIKQQILSLNCELNDFQEYTLKNLEGKLQQIWAEKYLN